jgi:ABC-type glycerol-3-phosphate transport system substrate-binding protein
MEPKLSRRTLLKAGAVVVCGALAGCAPKVVEVTRVIEQTVVQKEVVKETVQVEKKVEVTKVVEKNVTVVVDKQAQKAAAMKGKIIWDTFRAQPGKGQWGQDRLDNFKQMWPDVTVELRPIPQTAQQDAYGKMYAMEAAGDLGDVCAFDPSHFHFWRAIDKNIIMPVDEFVAADQLDLTQWFPQFIGMQYYKGKIYGLPSWGWSGYDCMVINLVPLEADGIAVPDPLKYDVSFDQMAEWIKKYHKPGKTADTAERYGFAAAGGEAGCTVMSRWFGGDLINPEGTKVTFLNDEKALKGLRWAYDLVVKQRLAPVPGAFTAGNDVACAEGRLFMYHCGSLCHYTASQSVKDPKVAKLSVLLFPKREDGKIPSQIRGGTWNVHKTSKLPQIAWEFVKTLSSKDGEIGFNIFGGNTGLTRPDIMDVLKAKTPTYKWFENNLINGMLINCPGNSRGREYTDALGQYSTKLYDPVNVISFEQGAQELSDAVQKVLDMPPA